MNMAQFKAGVAEARDEAGVDALCFKWLSQMTIDHGRAGKVAKVLLAQVKELTDD